MTAARLLAAAMFEESGGKRYVQAFPAFGMERRGAPVQAFLRWSEKPIPIRTYVYTPDVVVVLDPTLLKTGEVFEGLKKTGLAIINTKEQLSKVKGPAENLAVVDATGIAWKILKRPIVNTTMLGAFAAATNEVSVEAVTETIQQEFAAPVAKQNVEAVKRGYQETRMHGPLKKREE